MAKTLRRKVEELFQQAADLPKDERDAFLRKNCETHTILDEVKRLLHRLENPTIPSLKVIDDLDSNALASMEGERIHNYKLIKLLGEGGFGVIYLAEQEAPIKRRLAFKIIKLGMDTKQVIARFEAERQTLALMEHPNIAKVFDAGATDKGRPYFVMELVDGVEITEYCNKNQLNVEERLELFQEVCNAVQHAHQKGIIHRDLKPTNILVTLQDGIPAPKVIDFGIARAANPLPDETLVTQVGQFLGTPQYMSPEQGALSLDVDTRSDIYSLGVLLYELLTNTTPISEKKLTKNGLHEMHRILKEVDPPTPSQRIKNMEPKKVQKATLARKTTPNALHRALKGELDWIVMKALSKNRSMRYQTAGALWDDLNRRLNKKPVLAGPPSKIYWLRKTAARNKAALAIFILTVGFAVWMSLLYSQSNELRRQAETEHQTSSRVVEFLVDIFDVADPIKDQGEEITAREVLDRGAERIDSELKGQPFVQSALMLAMGRVYNNLGLYQSANPLLEKAAAYREETLGAEHLNALCSKVYLGKHYNSTERYKEAEALLKPTLKICRRTLGDRHMVTFKALKHLSWALQKQRKIQEAEPLCREALATSREILDKNDPDVVGALQSLAWLLRTKGALDEAESLCREALSISRESQTGPDLSMANSMNFLAVLLSSKGEFQEAEELLLNAYKIRSVLLGQDHYLTRTLKGNLAEIYLNQKKYKEAAPLFREVIEAENQANNRSQRMVNCRLNFGRTLMGLNKTEEGARVLLDALKDFRNLVGKDHPLALNLTPMVANLLLKAKMYEKTEALLNEFMEAQALDGPLLASVKCLLGRCNTKQARYEEAKALLEDSYRFFKEELGDRHGETVFALQGLVDLFKAWGKEDQAAHYSNLIPKE